MNKYAMVAINWKQPEIGKIVVRRVLISFESTKIDPEDERKELYINSRFVAKDDYFNKLEKSHQYLFEDDGYILLDCNSEVAEEYKIRPELYEKRPYHHWLEANLFLPVQLFEDYKFHANTDEEAIYIFNNRKEFR